MIMIRRLITLGFVAAVTGCITEPQKISRPEERVGSFSLTIQAFANGPTTGKATFQLERIENESSLSLSLIDSTGISIRISGPGTAMVGAEFQIGPEDGLFGGTVTRTTAAGVAVYTLTGGSLAITGMSATQLVGTLEFEAVQTEGPAVGTTASGKGTFRASGGNSEL